MVLLQAVKVLTLTFLAFLVALSATPLALRLLRRIGTGKRIKRDVTTPIYTRLHAHKEGTPNMAGVIIWGTVLALALVFLIFDFLFDGFWTYLNFVNRAETYLPLATMAVAALLGMVDDYLGARGTGPAGGGFKIRHKLLIYALVGAVGAWWFYRKLGWDELAVPFAGLVAIGWFYVPFFMFIIIASAFSANEADGLDGLAGGALLFAFIALTAVAFVLGRYDLATFGGVTVGALLAFLWFNIHPARFFMGDTGSMSLGITMGVIAMLTNTALLLPFFAPILVLESLSVIVQLCSKRFRAGKKVFLSTPIHNHFLALGWPESQVVMRFWIISAMGAALGLAVFFLTRYL